LKNGLFTDWFLFAPNCLRVAPPLTITGEEVKTACGIIQHACSMLAGHFKT
jgi:acetylornithine/N-succinyldiaminopimelate aminotransferase